MLRLVRRLLAAVAIVSLALPGTAQAAGDPIVIGLSVPLSPPGDVTAGQLIRRGAELAAEYVNTQMHGVLGREVQLAVEDDMGQPEAGVAAYRRLVSEKHAVAVTGYFHSSVNLAVNEVAKDVGVATIGTQTSAADVTAKHYEVAYRTHAIDPIRAGAFMSLIEKLKAKRVSLLAESTDYGVGNVKEFEQRVKESKKKIEVQSIVFDRASTDLTPQLLQIKNAKPDLVINLGVGQAADLIIDQANTIGLFPQTPMVLSYDAPIRPQFWQLHPKDGAGLYFVAYYSPQQKLSDVGQWFAKKFQEKYNEPPTYSSLNGFGDVLLIAEAVARAKDATPAKVAKALEQGSYKSWTVNPIAFKRSEGVYFHNWSPPVLILRYTKANENWRDAQLITSYAPKT